MSATIRPASFLAQPCTDMQLQQSLSPKQSQGMIMSAHSKAEGPVIPRLDLPPCLASQRVDAFTLASGLHVLRSEFRFQETLSIPFAIEENHFIFFGFQLSGGCSVDFHFRSPRYSYPGGKAILFSCQGEGVEHYSSSGPLQFVSICMDEEVLHAMLGDTIAVLPSQHRKAGTGDRYTDLPVNMTPGMRVAAHQAMQPAAEAPGAALYMESKALELLMLYCNALDDLTSRTPRKHSTYITPGDRDRLHAARDIIRQEHVTPPTIAALSRRVGMNECKLKHLFKIYFENTIYGYLLQVRMGRAKELLREGMSVSQVANCLGYVNNSHFAAAYRKHHGMSPSAMKRSTR